jgi:ribosomal protein L11 methylase PrmA
MIKQEESSFRDSKAKVYSSENKIFRKIDTKFNIDFKKFISSTYYKKNISKIIATKILDIHEINDYGLEKKDNIIWLEHEKLENIIYPYELTFDQLKDSAVLFLDLYINAIKESYDIIDASAYNIQFKNNLPIFIDLGSFSYLNKNSNILWHKQFCENYLGPLLIKSKAKINFNDFFKGNLDGVDLKVTSKILPVSSWFNFNILTNIHLHSHLNSKISSSSTKKITNNVNENINKKQKILIAKSLKKLILNLDSTKTSYWSSYSKINSYTDQTHKKKVDSVKTFIQNEKIQSLMDLGCNDGLFSELSFESGVKKIIGVDNDLDSLNDAYLKFKKKPKKFLPIYQNFTNPSPNIGWDNTERKSFTERYKKRFDGIICLAFIHHICVGNNIPFDKFIKFVEKFSDNILLEFVTKEDLMVKNLSRNKENIINEYNFENFKKVIKKNYKIISEENISNTRIMIHFKK